MITFKLLAQIDFDEMPIADLVASVGLQLAEFTPIETEGRWLTLRFVNEPTREQRSALSIAVRKWTIDNLVVEDSQ